MNLATYTLQILSPDADYGMLRGENYTPPLADKRVLANLPAMVESIEEDFTDLLPEGYEVRIREWQEEAVTE